MLWRPGDAWPPPPLAAATDDEWVVQDYVDGAPLSCFAVVRGGAIAAFVAYACELPVTDNGGGGGLAGFASVRATVDAPDAVAAASAVVDAAVASGWLDADAAPFCFGLDFVRDAASGALFVLECNPRQTNGAALLAADARAAAAALDVLRDAATDAAPARRRRPSSRRPASGSARRSRRRRSRTASAAAATAPRRPPRRSAPLRASCTRRATTCGAATTRGRWRGSCEACCPSWRRAAARR